MSKTLHFHTTDYATAVCVLWVSGCEHEIVTNRRLRKKRILYWGWIINRSSIISNYRVVQRRELLAQHFLYTLASYQRHWIGQSCSVYPYSYIELRGFEEELPYLVLFSLYSSLLGIERQKKLLKNTIWGCYGYCSILRHSGRALVTRKRRLWRHMTWFATLFEKLVCIRAKWPIN